MNPWDRRGSEREWYDVMQACENGHVITSMAKSYPEEMKKRCPACGGKTLTQCPNCGVEIQGYHHIPGVSAFGPPGPPPYCHECGEPFPWAQKILAQEQVGQSDKNTAEPSTTNIFVVHGHDEEIKQAVARTLSTLGLNPIILHEQPNMGKTIIEKFEKNAEVQFAVVLLSPDDMAYPANSTGQDASPRARQNVILELGYFVGKLGREKVFPLKKGNLDVPTDFSGVAYTSYDPAGHWRFELVRELKAAGYSVDANTLL